MMRNGILVGGNWIIDQVKMIDNYPSEERLVNISSEYHSNGGGAYNVLTDLSKMQVPFSLEGIGLVGKDVRGESILKDCKDLSIDITQMAQTSSDSTSYTDVMSVKNTGKRTFFHHRGTNALLDESYFDFSRSQAKIFHLGYLLLLDQLDKIDSDGTTGAARIFKKAKEQGFMTSADVVSEVSHRFEKVIPVSLPYIDILFVNEFEAEMLSGVPTTDERNELSVANCYEAAKKMIDMGVREWVILHFPDGILAVNRKEEKLLQPSLKLPAESIVGSVGAGDAVASGVLMGMHEGWDMKKCLMLGVCVAASSLMEVTASDGIVPYKACLSLEQQFGYRKI